MSKLGTITRRTLLIGSAAIAGGVAFGFYQYNKQYPNPLVKNLKPGEHTFNPYIKISKDGQVTIITARAEMGQGVTTTLAALVAEELEVDWTKIKIEHGPAGWAYYNHAMLEESVPYPHYDHSFTADATRQSQKIVSKFLGMQATGGSSSLVDAFTKMRLAGAAARHVLIKAAAAQMNADAASLKITNGTITDPASKTKLTFADVVAKAATIAPPSEPKLKPASQWKLLGKSQPRFDIPDKTTGKAVYGIDIDLSDMVYATIAMSPHFGAKMKSFDASKSGKMPGIEKIIDLGNGIAVIADNTWRAFKAAEATNIVWHKASYPSDNKAIFEKFDTALKSDEQGWVLRDDGDTNQTETIKGTYRAPYLAHTCMEPMNATAQWTPGKDGKDGKLEIWTGTQAPTLLQMIGAREFGITAEDIIINTTMLGGGFGRRFEIDFAVAAMRVAKHTDGRPVKVTWTREEDVTHDAYRPAALANFRASLDANGKPDMLDLRLATQPILASIMSRTFPAISPATADRTTLEGSFDQPYDIANYKVAAVPVKMDIPVGFWRSVGNSYNAFFHEGIINELAQAAKTDPLAMRLDLMAKHPTAISVMKKLADMAKWNEKRPQGHGLGVAFTLSFGAWVGEVVEVKNTDDGIKILNVWCVADVGMALDPANIKAQLISAIVYGLSAAMGQEITFNDGMVEQQNFDTYDAMRISQMPKIHTAILQNSGQMSGIGEPGTPPAAPALAAAIFAATGKRIRTLPLSGDVDFA